MRPSLESRGTNVRVPQKSAPGATAELGGSPPAWALATLGSPTPKTLASPKTGSIIPGLGPAFELSFCLHLPSSIYQAPSRADLTQVLGTQKQEDIVTALQGAFDPMT